MLKLEEFLSELEQFAPLKLSRLLVEKGSYDNSGIIVRCTENARNVLFTLDLSKESVAVAKRYKCDTIVTHHPAIYKPILGLDFDGVSAGVTLAATERINVISMHLNLDACKGGIDQSLAEGLGGENAVILDEIEREAGYGRLCKIQPITFAEFIKKAKTTFESDKVIYYGKAKEVVGSFASFCGAGSSDAIEMARKGRLDCDVIVTSDASHHVIMELVEMGYKIVLLTHYAAEEYGFKRFYNAVTEKLEGKVNTRYFCDKRFK